MRNQIYDTFGKPPSNIAPDIPVRYWDRVILYGLIGGISTYLILGFLVYHIINPLPNPSLQWWSGFHSFLVYLSLGTYDNPDALYYVSQHPLWFYSRMLFLWLGSACSAFAMARIGYEPKKNSWVIEGNELKEGKQALLECKQRTKNNKDENGLYLHPDLWLSKKQLSTHILIYGAIGSGKTQIMLRMMKQLIDRDEKLFIYDVKGDFTSYFDKPIIISPFDRRSYVWHIARDVATPTQASAFINSVIPEDKGSGKFWSDASRQIGYGIILSLQNEKPKKWTIKDLAERVSLKAEEMAPILWENYRKAHNLISKTDGQTAFNVLATLNGYTKVFDDMARAWPKPGDKWFSITEWVKDNYKGNKQIIVQAGTDKALVSAYISAMINVCIPSIITPALPDNEQGRFLGFFLDELPSIGRIEFMDLVDKGRSKGVVLIAGLQDLAQAKEIYGDNLTKSLKSMIGTQIICRVNQGDTCKELAEQFGSHLIAEVKHTKNAVVETKYRKVVKASTLTDEIGFSKGKEYKKWGQSWGIKAIVKQQGDPLLLPFPGLSLKTVRDGQEPAKWTTQPAGKIKDGKPYQQPEEKTKTGKGKTKTPATLEEIENFLR